ncbi:MAG: hypothetical protein ABI193_18425 [Minicystis sp.]
MPDDNPILRMLRGQRAAAARARELMRAEGPRPEQAVAEALAGAAALAVEGKWPAPRDPVSERGVEEVRRRWVHIARRALAARAR